MTLAYRLDGPAGAPVLVLANSLGTTWEMWEPQAGPLLASHRVLRYDQVGHGRSPLPSGPVTVEHLAGRLVALLDELGIERVSLCGLSLGGMVGMAFALEAPERLERLVLCCTSACLGPPERWEERVRAVRAGGIAAIAEPIIGNWFTPAFREREPATVEGIRQMLLATPVEGYAACCAAIRDWDARERLGAIAAPTLVVVGTEDGSTPPPHGELIARSIPGARLVTLSETAHLANLARPREVTEAVLAHLGAEAAR